MTRDDEPELEDGLLFLDGEWFGDPADNPLPGIMRQAEPEREPGTHRSRRKARRQAERKARRASR